MTLRVLSIREYARGVRRMRFCFQAVSRMPLFLASEVGHDVARGRGESPASRVRARVCAPPRNGTAGRGLHKLSLCEGAALRSGVV